MNHQCSASFPPARFPRLFRPTLALLLATVLMATASASPAWAQATGEKPAPAPTNGQADAVEAPPTDAAPASADGSPSADKTATPAEKPATSQPTGRTTQRAGASLGERNGLPTLDAIAARISSIEADQSLAEDLRTSLTAQWEAAQQALQAAAKARELAEDFATRAARGPEDLAKLTESLAQPLPEVTIDPPENPTADKLQQQLTEAEAELATARERVASIEQEARDRTRLRSEIPGRIAELRTRIQQLGEQIDKPAPPNEPQAVTEARRMRLRAERAAAEASIDAAQRELTSYDARSEVLVKRLDQAKRNALIAERTAHAWQNLVAQARARELQQQRQQAEEQSRQTAQIHPMVGQIAETNAGFVEQRATLDQLIRQTVQKQDAAREELEDITRQYVSITEKVDAAGLTDAIGLQLRKYREDLPDQRDMHRASEARSEAMGQVQLQQIELEDRRAELIDIGQAVDQFMAQLDPEPTSEAQRERIAEAARAQLIKQREFIDDLRRDLDLYFFELGDLDTTAQALLAQTNLFESYINENVLWIPSGTLLGLGHIKPTIQAAHWLIDGDNWLAAGEALWQDVRRNIAATLLLVLVGILLLISRRRLLNQLELCAGLTKQSYTDKLSHSFKAFIITIALAAAIPVAVYFIGYRLIMTPVSVPFVKALGASLQLTALVGLSLSIVRGLCRPNGMGEAHFRWREQAIAQVRRWANWLLYMLLPIILVAALLEAQPEEPWKESLGRLLFIAMMIVIAMVASRVMRVDRGVLAEIAKREPYGWIDRSRWVWFIAAVGGPIILAIVALVGYYYTAWQLSMRFFWTTWLLLTLVLVAAFAKRALTFSAKRIVREQARKRRAAEVAAREKADQGDGPPQQEVEIEESTELNIGAVSTQARQILNTSIGFALIIGVWLIWSPVLPALGVLDNITLWGDLTNPDSNPVTLANVVLAIILTAITIVATKNLPGLLEIAFLQRLPMGAGSRYAITNVARYAIAIVGITIAFNAIGIGWGKLQWLLAAMSVGLGFGLQEIFANFVSGLIILAEQPIRVGDTVTVGGVSGKVAKIRMRATTVVDFDKKELIVPNKEFVTGQLINWTLSDPTLRIVVPVGVAYGSDNEKVVKALFEAAERVPVVLKEPAPQMWFVGFGDSTLNYECRVFIPHIDYLLRTRHEMCLKIDEVFRENDIEIAFPQRDLHVRSIEAVLPFSKVDEVEIDGEKVKTIPSKDAPSETGPNAVQMDRPKDNDK